MNLFIKFINWLKIVFLGVDDLYFKLLKKAAEKGIYKWADISLEMQRHFHNHNNMTDSVHASLKRNVELFLQDISQGGYLKFQNDTPDINVASNTDCLTKIKASISITPEGVLFYYEKRKTDAVSIANKLTLLFIFCTVVLGILTAYFSKQTLDIAIKDDYYKEQLKYEHSRELHNRQELLLLLKRFDSANQEPRNKAATNTISTRKH